MFEGLDLGFKGLKGLKGARLFGTNLYKLLIF